MGINYHVNPFTGKFDGTADISETIALTTLSDVTITGGAQYDLLQLDGASEWVNVSNLDLGSNDFTTTGNMGLGTAAVSTAPLTIQGIASTQRGIDIDMATVDITATNSAGVYIRLEDDSAGGNAYACDFQVDITSNAGANANGIGVKGLITKGGTYTTSDIGTLTGIQAQAQDATNYTRDSGSAPTENMYGANCTARHTGNTEDTSGGTLTYNIYGGYFYADVDDGNTNANSIRNAWGGAFVADGKASVDGASITSGGYFKGFNASLGTGGDVTYDMYLDGTGEIHSNVGQLLLTASDPDGITGTVLTSNLAVYDVDNIGAEIVSNPSMTADTDWNKGTGWTHDGSGAYDYDGDGSGNLDEDVGVPALQTGIYYKIVWYLSAYTSGAVRILLGTNAGSSKSAIGWYTQVIKAGSGDTKVAFDPVGTSVLSVSQISVKPFSGGELSVQGDFYRAGSTDFFYDDHTWEMQTQDKDFIIKFLDAAVDKTITLDASTNIWEWGDTILNTTGAATVGALTCTTIDTGTGARELNQDVISGASPTFTGTNLTGIPYTGLANGVDGELITWDAAGAIAAVAVGTATHVLTSNGIGVAPTFQAPAGGAEVNNLETLCTDIATTEIPIGTAADTVVYAALSGDVTMDNAGVVSIGTDKVDSAHMNWAEPITVDAAQKIQFRDTGIFIHSNTNGEMTIEADSKVIIGVAGDIELGDSTERDMFPQTTKKINLGKGANKFNEIVCDKLDAGDGGIVTQLDTTAHANPPTDLECDTAFGQPATAGAGFIGVMYDGGGLYVAVSSGSTWYTIAGVLAT